MLKQIIIAVFVLALLVVALDLGIERYEKWECEKWKAQAEEYDGFFWTEWMQEQCGL